MMQRTSVASLLAAALLSAGCGKAPDRPVTPHPSAIAGGPLAATHASSDSAQLAIRIAALESAVQHLQAAGGTTAAPGPAPQSSSAPTGPDGAAQRTAELPPDDQQLAARTAQIQAAFYAEPADARWAQSAQAGIRRTLQEVGPAGLNAQVDCRSQSCRVVVAATSSDGGAWLQQLTMRLAPSFSTVRIFGAGSANSTVLYLST
jgi:hypothetical protein